jgi:hypothetical protein
VSTSPPLFQNPFPRLWLDLPLSQSPGSSPYLVLLPQPQSSPNRAGLTKLPKLPTTKKKKKKNRVTLG